MRLMKDIQVLNLSWVGAGFSKEGRNLFTHSNAHVQEALSPQFILYNNNLEGVSYALKNDMNG